MRRTLFFGVLGLFILGACSLFYPRRAGPGMGMQGIFFSGDFSSNGEQIYLTATNEGGEFIRYTGGPGTRGMMMGAYLTCAACHGADGRGGVHSMHMQVMDAPDIRFEALRGEAGGHGDDDHGDEHGEYSLDDFRRAVVDGRHPDGEPLDRDMPRWRLDDGDLEDLLAFLKTLS